MVRVLLKVAVHEHMRSKHVYILRATGDKYLEYSQIDKHCPKESKRTRAPCFTHTPTHTQIPLHTSENKGAERSTGDLRVTAVAAATAVVAKTVAKGALEHQLQRVCVQSGAPARCVVCGCRSLHTQASQAREER